MMKKKNIFVSVVIMCFVMLVSTMSVWAAYDSYTVNLDDTMNGYATIFLSDNGEVARVNTSGQSLYNDILMTKITGYTANDARTFEGVISACVTGENMLSASSYHKWTSRTCTLTVYN